MPLSPEIRLQLLRQPIDIPVFHPVALRLTIMVPDPYSDFDDIVQVISEDQALSAQVLKMANSSAYMGLVRADTIKASALRLGVQQISALAMAASQASLHTSDIDMVNEVMRELWQHSLACALGGWWVARNAGHESIMDHVYLAALLHDIGKLYLLKSVERMARTDGITAPLTGELLTEIFSELHVEVGCRIMDHWNIPAIYRSIVEKHHDDRFDPVDSILTIVRLVNLASRNVGLSLDQEDRIPTCETPEAAALGMDESQCAALESAMKDFTV